MLISKLLPTNFFRMELSKPSNLKSIKYYALLIVLLISGLIYSLKILEYEKFKSETKLFNNVLVRLGFTIKNIDIDGTKNLSHIEVLNIFADYKGINIFNVDLNKIHTEISKNNWVKNVYLKRVMPNKIKVSIIENKPIGIWQNTLGNNILTKEGILISNYKTNVLKMGLPIIKSEKINQNIFKILKILKTNKQMADDIWSLSYINMRRLDLHFKQGLTVRMPSENFTKAWHLVTKLNQKYNILNLGLTEIDLRNSKQILGKINFDKTYFVNRKNS